MQIPGMWHFSSMQSARARLKRIHLGQRDQQPTQCAECGKILSSKGGATRHYKTVHLGQRPLTQCECSGCGKILSSKGVTTKHYKRVHLGQRTSSEKPTHCEYPGCGKISSSRGNVKKHYQSKHSVQLSQTQCEYPGCGKMFSGKVPMKHHYRVKHLGQPKNPTNHPTQCYFPGCGKIYSSKQNQRYHYQTTHLSVSKKRITLSERLPCTYPGCDKSFVNKYTLKHHYQQFHVARSSFRCDHCEWKSPEKPTFFIHLLRARDQRQLLIVPPKPGIEISELNSFLQFREEESHKAAQTVATIIQESNFSSKTIGQDPSLTLPNIDPQLRKSEGISALTVRERNCHGSGNSRRRTCEVGELRQLVV